MGTHYGIQLWLSDISKFKPRNGSWALFGFDNYMNTLKIALFNSIAMLVRVLQARLYVFWFPGRVAPCHETEKTHTRACSTAVSRMIGKIASDGQTGVDIAAADAAIKRGIEYGSWCPKGRINEAGKIDEKYECFLADRVQP